MERPCAYFWGRFEALGVAPAPVEELTADFAQLTAGTEHAKEECDTLAARIHEQEVSAAPLDGEFGFVGQAVRSLKDLVAAGEEWASTAEIRAVGTLCKISINQALV